LFKARALDAQSSALFARVVDFASKADGLGTDQAAVREVISDELPMLLNNMALADFVSAAVDQMKQDPLASLAARMAVAKVLLKTNNASVQDASSLIVEGGLDGRGVTVESCREALVILKGFGDEATDAKGKWVAAVLERFPLLNDFDS
jgi:hypothetical protein